MKLDDLLGGLGRGSNSGIVRDPGLFSGTSFLRTLGGHRYGREIIRQIKDLFPEIGEKLEQAANIMDSLENVLDALPIFIPDRYPYPNPCPRIPPFLKDQAESYSEAEAEDALQMGGSYLCVPHRIQPSWDLWRQWTGVPLFRRSSGYGFGGSYRELTSFLCRWRPDLPV